MADMLQPRSPQQDFRNTANVAVGLAGVFAVTSEVFLHRCFGHRYLGGKAGTALIVIPVFGALCFPHHSQVGLTVFWCLYLLALLKAQGEAKQLRAKGVDIHSRYNGWPKKLKLGASEQRERRVKTCEEPMVVAIMGALVYLGFDQPLGGYLMVSGCSLAFTNSLYRIKAERQDDDMRDAMIEQQMMADRMDQFRRAG
ncbi:MAG: hypothetical protein K1X71_13020 [Pirellulales bacterium]|nr:hypothetical protein [Pirellulales bacterium]